MVSEQTLTTTDLRSAAHVGSSVEKNSTNTCLCMEWNCESDDIYL